MSDLATFIATCLTAVGGTLLLSADPQVSAPSPNDDGASRAVFASTVVAPSFISSGRLFMTSTINGRKIDLMIDTGASHTVLSRHDAHRLGISGTRPINVETLGGTSVVREANAETITLEGRTLQNWPILISDTSDISLLGMDLLNQMGRTHLALQPAS